MGQSTFPQQRSYKLVLISVQALQNTQAEPLTVPERNVLTYLGECKRMIHLLGLHRGHPAQGLHMRKVILEILMKIL